MTLRKLIYLLILNITNKTSALHKRERFKLTFAIVEMVLKRETIIEKCVDAVHEDWKFSETSSVVLCFVLSVHLSFYFFSF